MERDAAKARDRAIANGGKVPPICGYTYKPRKPKNPKVKYDPKPVTCMRVAGSNTTHHGKGFCDYHDILSEIEVENAGSQINAARRIAYEHARFFGEPIDIDPHTAILDEIKRSAAILRWLEEQMEIERAQMMDLFEGSTNKRKAAAQKSVVAQFNQKTGSREPSVWMTLFNEERKHLVSTCIAAIKAGIAERKVRIAEQQGQMIAAMMLAFIHDPALALTPEQILRAPELIRRHLLSLAHETPAAIDPAQVLETQGVEIIR